MQNILNREQISNGLTKIKGWKSDGLKLTKRFEFNNFAQAMRFVNAVSVQAESLNHHPDWSNSYKIVDISLTTHSAGGITDLDFQLAEKIEQVQAEICV